MARIAFVLAADFEDSEFRIPYDGLLAAGHDIDIIGVRAGEKVKGKAGQEEIEIEQAADDVDPSDYDALVIPGGYSPDHLRIDPHVVELVRQLLDRDVVIAAVCHGPQLLIEVDAVRGKTVTSWPSVKVDLINAGADWVDREVVVDGQLITSRKPDDLPAFTRAIEEHLAAGAEDIPAAQEVATVPT